MSHRSAVQTELKTTRQIPVRFGHAPCVKLTLEARPARPPATNGVRVLKLVKPSTLTCWSGFAIVRSRFLDSSPSSFRHSARRRNTPPLF